MSIISDIAAEHHRGVVDKAIAKAKRETLNKYSSKTVRDAVDKALKIVKEYCDLNISE